MSTSPGRRRADLSPRPYRLLREDIAPKLSARPGKHGKDTHFSCLNFKRV